MDMREASAMTEASGLVDELETRRASATTPGREAQVDALSLPSPLRRFSEHLREITLKAPLQSLFVAFLLGVWVARRR
ncbi:hypothetical protein AC628_15140 [Bradyrhizobium sp. NAS96.2]|nr:hypothetical protein AC628_15140 [Bradyrhizobium sp. NAS96.2]